MTPWHIYLAYSPLFLKFSFLLQLEQERIVSWEALKYSYIQMLVPQKLNSINCDKSYQYYPICQKKNCYSKHYPNRNYLLKPLMILALSRHISIIASPYMFNLFFKEIHLHSLIFIIPTMLLYVLKYTCHPY